MDDTRDGVDVTLVPLNTRKRHPRTGGPGIVTDDRTLPPPGNGG
ncbi:hypothetical protein ACFWMR_09760 [Amycolatopsis thailandensis]